MRQSGSAAAVTHMHAAVTHMVHTAVTHMHTAIFHMMHSAITQIVHAMGCCIAFHLVANLAIGRAVFFGDPLKLYIAFLQHFTICATQVTFLAFGLGAAAAISFACFARTGTEAKNQRHE